MKTFAPVTISLHLYIDINSLQHARSRKSISGFFLASSSTIGYSACKAIEGLICSNMRRHGYGSTSLPMNFRNIQVIRTIEAYYALKEKAKYVSVRTTSTLYRTHSCCAANARLLISSSSLETVLRRKAQSSGVGLKKEGSRVVSCGNDAFIIVSVVAISFGSVCGIQRLGLDEVSFAGFVPAIVKVYKVGVKNERCREKDMYIDILR